MPTNVKATVERFLALLETEAAPAQQITILQSTTTTSTTGAIGADLLAIGGWWSYPVDEPIVAGLDVSNHVPVPFACRIEQVRITRKGGTGLATFDIRRAPRGSSTFTTLFSASGKPSIPSGASAGGQSALLTASGALLAGGEQLCWDVVTPGDSVGVLVVLYGRRLA